MDNLILFPGCSLPAPEITPEWIEEELKKTDANAEVLLPLFEKIRKENGTASLAVAIYETLTRFEKDEDYIDTCAVLFSILENASEEA